MTISNNRNSGQRVVVTQVAVDWLNRSGTIAVGGSAQPLAAANPKRKGLWIQNQSSGSLWINDLGAATQGSPSLEITTGKLYEIPYGGVTGAALSIIGATTDQVFSAREW